MTPGSPVIGVDIDPGRESDVRDIDIEGDGDPRRDAYCGRGSEFECDVGFEGLELFVCVLRGGAFTGSR